MGYERLAQVLARVGLASRCDDDPSHRPRAQSGPPDDEPQSERRRRRVVAKYPGHTWHSTSRPYRLGPDSGCRGFHSRCLSVGRSVGGSRWRSIRFPGSAWDSPSLRSPPRPSRSSASSTEPHRDTWQAPRYVVTDKGRQFWCRSFKAWCKRRGIRPRYGRIGEPASIAIVERFIRSMKSECTRCLLVPVSLEAMRRELRLYATGTTNGARTWRSPGRRHTMSTKAARRFGGGSSRGPMASSTASSHGRRYKVRLAVSYVEGREASACHRASPRCLIVSISCVGRFLPSIGYVHSATSRVRACIELIPPNSMSSGNPSFGFHSTWTCKTQ